MKTGTRQRPPSNQRAFTLIELMLVLVLIAIMTAMIVPEMRGTHEEAVLRASARKMADVLNLAASKAISSNEPQQLRLERTTGRYRVESVSTSDLTATNGQTVIEGQFDKRIRIEIRPGERETLDESQEEPSSENPTEELAPNPSDRIRFFANGAADAAEVVFRDSTGAELSLKINPTTGRVRIARTDER